MRLNILLMYSLFSIVINTQNPYENISQIQRRNLGIDDLFKNPKEFLNKISDVGQGIDRNVILQQAQKTKELLNNISKQAEEQFNLEQYLQSLADQLESEEFSIPELFGFLESNDNQNDQDTNNQFNTEDITEQVNLPSLLEKWPELMQNFQPDDMLSFELDVGSLQTLYQEILTPTTIRGAFFIPFYPRTNKIDFQIKTLDNIILHQKEGVQDHIFNIEIKHAGEYKFMFYNKRSDNSIIVNFALDVHNSSQEHLQSGDIDPFSLRVENIHNAMRDNYFETKFTQSRQEEGYLFLVQTHQKLLIFTLFETAGVVAINLWQIFYIKRILENKRLI